MSLSSQHLPHLLVKYGPLSKQQLGNQPFPMVLSCIIFSLVISLGISRCLAQNGTDFAARNLHTIQSIYNLTVYPNNVPVLQHGGSAVPSGLFNANPSGRITPLGNFTGFDDSVEYFFALAPTPQTPPGNAIYRADVVEFTSGCPEVASSVVYLRTGRVDANTGQHTPSSADTVLKQVRNFSRPLRYTNLRPYSTVIFDLVNTESNCARLHFGNSTKTARFFDMTLGFRPCSGGLLLANLISTAPSSSKVRCLPNYVPRFSRDAPVPTSNIMTWSTASRSWKQSLMVTLMRFGATT